MITFNITIKQIPGIPKISAVSTLARFRGIRIPIFSLNIFKNRRVDVLQKIDTADFING